MENNYISQIKNLFRNITLNAVGAERDLYTLLADGDVSTALSLFSDNSKEVDKAISEYNPQTHRVMYRHDKDRRGKNPYISEKLPRTRARYINEIELFFLLGKPIVWRKTSGEDEAYTIYTDFLREIRFDSLIRKAKRLAGAETESAIIFELTGRNGEIEVQPYVAARSLGYHTLPMFDQYGRLMALAVGYSISTNIGRNSEEHWDILTPDIIFKCAKKPLGWEVEQQRNITGKINALYFRQTKAWDGAVPRIEREEMLDSRIADTNNYFADPIAEATADVIEGLSDPDTPGKMIRLTGANSRFQYINPPQNSEIRATEKRELQNSILFDTFTPDFSYESIRGLGSLSGAAMHNALILGYIKRDVRKELYGEMVDRFRSVAIAILKQRHPSKATMLDGLKIEFEFAEPFDTDRRDFWASIGSLYGQGLVSLEVAVKLLSLTGAPDEEIARIQMARMEAQQAQVEAATQAQQIKAGGNGGGPAQNTAEPTEEELQE